MVTFQKTMKKLIPDVNTSEKLKSMGIADNLLKIVQRFLSDRFQKVVLNGQSSEWAAVKAGVPQGSILGPLLFLVYINDISNGISSNVKLFADDTSLFSVIWDSKRTSDQLNSDLVKISQWAYKWKMLFNPDPTKQAQEVIFSRKNNKSHHPTVFFNDSPVQNTNVQKHLGLYLDHKLNFNYHIKEKVIKVNKGIGLLRKLRYSFPRKSLITIYKSFIRPHFDYADIIYDQPYNDSFSQHIESFQYNAALAITGAIRGTSQDKLYNELGIESLRDRRWFRRLCTFYRIKISERPSYLFDCIPKNSSKYNTRNNDTAFGIFCRTESYKNSFFPYTIDEWNRLDSGIRNSNSYLVFRKQLLNFIRPIPNSIFNLYNPLGIKFLTRLRLDFSHLNEHRFRHNFEACLTPLCTCSQTTESTLHFFLHCHHYKDLRTDLFNDIKSIDKSIVNFPDETLLKTLLYGDSKLTSSENFKLLEATIKYILASNRFNVSLF